LNEPDVSTIWESLGLKRYELTNHLGNVVATISDKPVSEGALYKPELISAQDYYPFGMLQPDRSYSLGSYRYGFNGKENDNEVKREANQQDYGMRTYDPRVARFLSVDPLTPKYPELTPYQFASNTPIQATDVDGLEAFFIHGTTSSSERWTENPKLIPTLLKLANTYYTNISFNWKAPLTNNAKDRSVAAKQLATYVINNRVNDEEITLIAHSHGGNVAIQAAEIIYKVTGQKVN
jgi:RHS repeat-associated protein